MRLVSSRLRYVFLQNLEAGSNSTREYQSHGVSEVLSMAMNLDKVAPRLYVGGIFSARTSSLDRNDITHVLSVTPDVRTLPGNAKTVKAHKCLEDVADRPDVDILRYLPEGVGFIEEALDTSEENRVLVHCTQGVSRSVTFVCAYCEQLVLHGSRQSCICSLNSSRNPQ